MSHGFLGAPEAFEAARRDDFMTAWDVAYFDAGGFYYICDREKDMVISGGINIYPREIENVLERHPSVFECAVIGVPDEEWGERLKAFAVLREGQHELEPEAILDWCAAHLAGHKMPRTLNWVKELPHTLSGKIDKKVLRGAGTGNGDRET